MPFFVWEGELSVRAIPVSGSAVRSRERVFLNLSAPVASAWDPGRSRAQAMHPRRRLCSMRPAGGAAPPFGAPLTAAALPAPLPGRPLRPRWEARRPRPLSPAPAEACLCCFLSLARPPSACSSRVCPEVESPSPRRIARTCSGSGSSPGVHWPPQVAESSAENEPAPPPPAPSPGCGGRGSRRAAAVAAAASGGGWDAASRGLGAEDQQIRLAQGRLGDGEPCTRRGARAPQQRRCAGLSRTRGPGRFTGLPGPQPCAAQHPRLASGPALRPAWPARAASSRSCRPGSADRCSAPARLTGAGARCRCCVSPPARPPRHGPISCSREAVTTVTRRRVLREAGPGAATRAFRGKIQRPAGRLSNLFPQAGTRRGLLLKDYNSQHVARLSRAKESGLEAQGLLVVVVPLWKN